MTSAAQDWFMAVDGGGTRCRLALISCVADVRTEAGAANVTTDIHGAIRELNAGLEVLSDRAGLARETLAQIPAYLGLAGYHAIPHHDPLRAGVPLKRMKLEDDRPAALRGALEDKDGALIHSGTGSFFGVQRDGKRKFTGGWGAVLGDYGSAAWFGKTALAMVLDAEDGLIAKTPLTRALFDRFGGGAGILEFARSAAPADFGALAPAVLAVSDDPVAQGLLRKSARHFDRNLRSLGWSADMPVCLTGGLAPHLAPFLTDDVRNNLTEAAGVPLDGAIALAREFAKEGQFAC